MSTDCLTSSELEKGITRLWRHSRIALVRESCETEHFARQPENRAKNRIDGQVEVQES